MNQVQMAAQFYSIRDSVRGLIRRHENVLSTFRSEISGRMSAESARSRPRR